MQIAAPASGQLAERLRVKRSWTSAVIDAASD
jgi:hypothetical protein